MFSFGLVLHVVVTGRKLFASIMNKKEQLHLLYHNDFPQLSSALADALSESKPLPTSPSAKFPSLMEEGEGHHPAGRVDVISSCHSTCMQPLMASCLASNPCDRPTAQGLCSRLLICPGAMSQSDYYITEPVISASYSQQEQLVVGIQGLDHVTLFPPRTCEIRRCPTPYSGLKFSCVEVIGSELFLATRECPLLYSLTLPHLQSGHISSTPLDGGPCCLFSYQATHGPRVIVGMTGAKVAMFATPQGGGYLLESQPLVAQVRLDISTETEFSHIRCLHSMI